MIHQDLKIAIINLLTFALSFSNMESFLKIILLIVSIAYTGLKVYGIVESKFNKNKDDETNQKL